MTALSPQTQRLVQLQDRLIEGFAALLDGRTLPRLTILLPDLAQHAQLCHRIAAVGKSSGVGTAAAGTAKLREILLDRLTPELLIILDDVGRSEHAADTPHFGRMSAIDAGDIVSAIADWERIAFSTSQTAHLQHETARRLYTRIVKDAGSFATRLEAADYAELGQAAALILRIETTGLVLDSLRQASLSMELKRTSRRLARLVMRSVGRTVREYLKSRDMAGHFDVSAVLAEIDDLLLVLLRIMDGEREEAQEGAGHPFIVSLGEDTLDTFKADIEALLEHYLAIAGRALTNETVSPKVVEIFARHIATLLQMLNAFSNAGGQHKFRVLAQQARLRIAEAAQSAEGLPGTAKSREKIGLLRAVL